MYFEFGFIPNTGLEYDNCDEEGVDKKIGLIILSISSLSTLLLFILVSAFIICCQELTTESNLESSNNQENRNGTNKLLNENELRRDSLSLGSVMTAVKANEIY